jgi:F420-non-reducing hydrogenase iron-sulfur subunit
MDGENLDFGRNIMSDFEPKIIAFCCEYCGYAAADLAGSMRLDYPAAIKVIRVPCTGRMDTLTVMKAFENGADGVFFFGCLEGSCHFVEGNIRARKRLIYIRELLEECGLGAERVGMFNTSAAMGVQFAQAARDVTERILALGPNPVHLKMKTDEPVQSFSEGTSS